MVEIKNIKNRAGSTKLSSKSLQSKNEKVDKRSRGVKTDGLLKKPVQFKFRPVIKPVVRRSSDLGLSKPYSTKLQNSHSIFSHRKYDTRSNYTPAKEFGNRYNANYVDKHRLAGAQPEDSVTPKPPVKRALFLLLKRTNNNIFMSLSYRNGLPIYQTSGGATGISGSKRDTPASAETAAKLLVNQVVNRGYTKCYLRIDSVYDNTLRGAVRGLQSSGLLTFTKIQHLKTVAHNGVRKSKPRRT